MSWTTKSRTTWSPSELVDGVEELVLVAGKEPAVDVRGGVPGDDVHLGAGVEHRRVDGVGQRRADDPRQRAEHPQQLLGVVRIQVMAQRVGELGHERLHGGRDAHREPVRPDAGDSAGRAR